MAGSVWFDAVDTFKEYGMESKVILDDLIRAMEVREAETNICYLAQSYDISLEEYILPTKYVNIEEGIEA